MWLLWHSEGAAMATDAWLKGLDVAWQESSLRRWAASVLALRRKPELVNPASAHGILMLWAFSTSDPAQSTPVYSRLNHQANPSQMRNGRAPFSKISKCCYRASCSTSRQSMSGAPR